VASSFLNLIFMKNLCLFGLLLTLGCTALEAAPAPPRGFSALFNGKDLMGWRGGTTYDHRALQDLSPEQRAAKIAGWSKDLGEHWTIENEELVNDGKGFYLTTEKDYGDFELLLEYKTVEKADSGIYLRGVPQVQIWDSTDTEKFKLGADKGSGGLWNNPAGSPGKDPLVKADKPFGEWNQVRIVMVGSRVSVWLNGQMTVDHAILENYYDNFSKDPEIKANPRPVPRTGPVQLQTHGGEIRWKNVFLREIGGNEANQILASHGIGSEWKSLFNGKDLSGWQGPVENYEVIDGAIVCKPKKGGTLHTVEEYANFKVRFEFKLPPGGNNGLAIRYPGTGDTAYVGMCEVQILDDTDAKYVALDPRQYCGSLYGMVAPNRGFLRPLGNPVGEWNFEEVTVEGSKIKVELNGNVIVNADLAAVTSYVGNKAHPGKDRMSGFFGLAGHNDPVAFRALQILPLK
jgi:hypothetical protein